jgi:hypothetical protein
MEKPSCIVPILLKQFETVIRKACTFLKLKIPQKSIEAICVISVNNQSISGRKSKDKVGKWDYYTFRWENISVLGALLVVIVWLLLQIEQGSTLQRCKYFNQIKNRNHLPLLPREETESSLIGIRHKSRRP